tara:strand:- start:729 stop:1001 length:273 start_codon:yes stop_codon:yes gene_type:complete
MNSPEENEALVDRCESISRSHTAAQTDADADHARLVEQMEHRIKELEKRLQGLTSVAVVFAAKAKSGSDEYTADLDEIAEFAIPEWKPRT